MVQRSQKGWRRGRGPILLAASLALLFAIDVAVKGVYESVRGKVAPDADKRLRTRSEIYHHGLRPNVAVTGMRWGDRTYHAFTSSLGFRDARVREVPLKGSRHRVLFIGDSFTEAPVPWEESFVGIIAGALESRGVEVLNAGVASYSPAIYYAKCRHYLETVGLRVDEIVVFVDISDAYDDCRYQVTDDGRVRSLESRMPEWVKDHTVIAAEFVRVWQRWTKKEISDPSGPKTVRSYNAAWTWNDQAYEEYGRRGQERMVRHMDALLTLARKHGVRLSIAFHPWPAQLYHRERPCRSRQLWTEWALEREVGALDLYPAFQSMAWETAVQRYYVPGDVHWNAAGNALVARIFLEAVKRGEILTLPGAPSAVVSPGLP
jgi:hypothetical protein